ncbi:CpaF family protein [Parafannyhessea umbonata]|uniref:Pilus assembly protein CpaF n=1 Tax=Parafannyhessea umbonata TaxID=604330 RepID=A0A1H9N6U1_9ACTN|nr:CpaF family protein [Parafannyhessea umbonata]SER31365.1 pilus assembly protein CpaF [Parafannyhessea umbonata]
MSVLERVVQREGSQEVSSTRRKSRELGKKLREQLVDCLGLEVIAGMVDGDGGRRVRDELAVTCRSLLNDEAYDNLLESERDQIVREVLDDVCGLGPIQSLLDDDDVSEVIVNGPERIFYERGGRLCQSEASFESSEQVLTIIDRILAPLGRRLDRASPIVNARLANGDRVNAVADPIAIGGPAVTIRKFSNRITSLSELVRLGALPQWYAQLLTWAVRTRRDVAVAGGTGSGKTTLLNALSCEIGLDERIVTIEDSAELRFNTHPDVVRLEARDASIEGTGEITIRDLVKNALRMRPDRIVVGEVRSSEAIDMLTAMNTGHDGSLTTLHAGTPDEAIMRLVLMARFGMDLPTDIIEEQIATALDVLVMSNRFPDGERRITTLSEVSHAPGGGVGLTECVAFDKGTRTWRFVEEPRFVEESLKSGALPRKEVEQWRRLVPVQSA